LDDLRDHAQDRFASFREWLKSNWEKVSGHAKDKHEQFMNVAREIRDHAKEMHKDTVREAVEALRPHKEELGSLWREVLDSAKNAFRKPNKEQ
jgi:predicted nucleotide-binding protein (sugar kinase/HSP70/actin superfamily)